MNQPVNPDGPNDRARDQGRRFLEDPLTRFDARVLDPSTAVRLTTGEAPSATVYVGDTLLVTASDRDDAEELLELLRKAVELSGLPLRWLERNPFRPSDDPDHDRRARLLTLAAEFKLPLVFPVRFESASDGPAPAVDVWPLLQAIRQAAFDDGGHAPAEPSGWVEPPDVRGRREHQWESVHQGYGEHLRQSLHARHGHRFRQSLHQGDGWRNQQLCFGRLRRQRTGLGCASPPLRCVGERQHPQVVVLDTGSG